MTMIIIMIVMKGDRSRGGAQGKQGVETRCRGYLRQPCSSTGDCDYDGGGGGEDGGGDGGEGEGEDEDDCHTLQLFR